MKLPLSTPHDLLFKATVADRERADSVLRAHLPTEITALLSSQPPLPLEGSFVDPELRGSQTDKLFRLELRSGDPVFVYALLEHKAYSDPAVVLQLARYKLRIWARYRPPEGRHSGRLPAILPLVFYHGREPWTAPPCLAAMLVPAEWHWLEASFGYFLRDLGALELTQLADQRAAWAGLVALRYAHGGAAARAEQERVLPEVLAALPDTAEYSKQVIVYLMNVWGLPLATLQRVAATVKPGRGEQLMGEVVQELIDQGKALGRKEGRVEGRKEGRVEGRVEGQATALIRLLEHRFGQLPQATCRRIRAATPEELEARLLAALDASSLLEVLGTD